MVRRDEGDGGTWHGVNCVRCIECNAVQGLRATRRVLMISGLLTPCNEGGRPSLQEWIMRCRCWGNARRGLERA